ncbi:hypothetical protein [Nocardia alni]|uniref:hypothetical protein n=1 Tax=Nocardia alni TaxID=2815723 RepID=UPI001C23B46E|nr:hypothetical protein [Nocardia alni]
MPASGTGSTPRDPRENRRRALTLGSDPGARFVTTATAQAIFATAPVLDYDELQRDLDDATDDELSDALVPDNRPDGATD